MTSATNAHPRSPRVGLILIRHQGIPDRERRECHKNALSDEMRHYLDAGVLPRATPGQTSKSEERRPVQAVPAREKCFGPTASVKSRTGEELPVIVGRVNGGPAASDDESSGGDAHHAAHYAAPRAQANATISIASLFGWGHDREKEQEGDY